MKKNYEEMYHNLKSSYDYQFKLDTKRMHELESQISFLLKHCPFWVKLMYRKAFRDRALESFNK
jgi:hypothetical protein